MTDEQKETDPRKMTNTERKILWAETYISRLWILAESKDLYVKVISYFRNQVRPRAEYTLLRVNLKSILDYMAYLIMNGFIKIWSAGTEITKFIHFANNFKKPFKKFTRKDIENFLQSLVDSHKSEKYIDNYRNLIKVFFRWLYGIERGDGYPDVVKWMGGNRAKSKVPDILTMEEIGRMIEVCDNLRDRAIISVLYESGCRGGCEILGLKIKDITFDNYGAVIIVNGKTGQRRIRLVSSVVDLKNWLNTHPKRNEENAPLFYSMSRNSKFTPLSCNSLDVMVDTVAKRANITKHVYPHLLRHTRATHLAKVLTEQELKKFFGWTPASNMVQTYIHLSGADIDNKILEINGLKQKDGTDAHRIPTIMCWSCKELNSVGNKFCCKCASPIDKDSTELQRVREFKSFMLPKLIQLFRDGEMEKKDFIDAIELFEKESNIKNSNETKEEVK